MAKPEPIQVAMGTSRKITVLHEVVMKSGLMPVGTSVQDATGVAGVDKLGQLVVMKSGLMPVTGVQDATGVGPTTIGVGQVVVM